MFHSHSFYILFVIIIHEEYLLFELNLKYIWTTCHIQLSLNFDVGMQHWYFIAYKKVQWK